MVPDNPKTAAPDHPWAELLPWYVNGTLAGEELSDLEAHLGTCLSCRRDLDELSVLRKAVHSADDPHLAPGRNFARLMARIDAAGEPTVAGKTRRIRASPREAFRRLFNRSHPAVRLVLVAQSALVLILSGVLLFNALRPTIDETARFRTLTDGPVHLPGERALVSLVFVPSSSADERRRAIDSVGARIVSGPGETNSYTVAIAAPADFSAPMTAAAIDALRANPAVITAKALGQESALAAPGTGP